MKSYEEPEVVTLGPVEELTFGGNLYHLPIDHVTGYVGYRPVGPGYDSDAE